MSHLVKLLFVLPATLAAACTGHQTVQAPPERIVVIFSPRPEIPNRYDYPDGSYGIHNRPILSFRSEKPGEQIPPVDSLSTDTLSIPLTGQRVIATLRYNFASEAELLLHNGDTVLVRMGGDSLPQIEVTNREAKDADLNFDAMRAQRYGRRYGFTTQDHYSSQGMFIAPMMQPKGYLRIKEIRAELSGKYAGELEDEAPWIDSLHTAGLLSDEARDFYAARNTFRRQMQDIHPIVRTISTEAQTGAEAANKYLPLLRQYDDSLYRNDFYGYYRKYYEVLAGKCLGSTKSIRTSNSIYSDFTESFDRMERDSLSLGLLREVMLARYFEGINENFSIDDAKRYYDRLLAQLSDTTLRRVVGTRFGSELGRELQKEDDISLVSIAGGTTSLRKIIADNRGKVIYIDFYASWCAPCMAGMPASEQLRKHYADKEVVFVYLALNDKPDKWRNALEKAHLQGVAHNYLILEPRLSTMIETLEIQSIPRLLLFDRRGELAHRNAPRPEAPEVRREIDKLLAAGK